MTGALRQLEACDDGTVFLRLNSEVLMWPDAIRISLMLLEAAGCAAALVGAERDVVRDVVHRYYHEGEGK